MEQHTDIMDLIARAPWREAVTYRETWPHEYVVIKKRRSAGVVGDLLRAHRPGRGVECSFFQQSRKYLFLGDYKYWTMTECSKIDLGADDYVLNRAPLYHDRRDFVIGPGDTDT